MKYWLKHSALLLLAAALVFAFVWHYQEPERKYESIQGGMTPAEVEAVMGRPPDDEDGWYVIWEFAWCGKERSVGVVYNSEGRVVHARIVTSAFVIN